MKSGHIVGLVLFSIVLFVLFGCLPQRRVEPKALTYRVYLPLVIKNVDSARGVTTCCGSKCADLEKLNVTWYYNWGVVPSCGGSEVEFVPLIRGPENIGQLMYLPASEWLAGYNEPNNPGQGVATPQQAASTWSMFEATGRRLISPAPYSCDPGWPSNCLQSPYSWMDEFLAACVGCRIDVIGVHWYGSDMIRLEQHLQRMAIYGKPLWMTEFGCMGDNVLNCMQQALPIIRQYTERHAWFSARFDPPSQYPSWNQWSLIDPATGGLTILGNWYADN